MRVHSEALNSFHFSCVSLASTGAQVQIGVDPSKVQITKLHMDPDRKKLLERKSRSAEKGKGKYSEADVDMANVD